MKNPIRLLLLCLLIVTVPGRTFAQNWQYQGNPYYIQQNTSLTSYFYFGDLEFNAAGDMFVGYWAYNNTCYFAQYSGGTWTQFTSPGSFPVSNVDIEVQGTEYYYAYSGVRGSNMYVYVTKYDGTGWNQVGDSMLLGNSGSGGWFDFLLDNSGVPTVLGVVSGPFADKQIMQYTGGTWSSVITLANTPGTIFRENSAIFDNQNKLLCVTQEFVTTPSIQYFNIVNKIDGGVRTTVGDTLLQQSANSRIKMDATNTPYLVFTSPIISKVMAYKLSGGIWTMLGDTTGTTGAMLNADVTGDGKVVFTVLNSTPHKSVFYYENNTRVAMDSVNVAGFAVGAISDLAIPAGSSDAYILINEVKPSAAQDLAVLKHGVSGSGPSAIGNIGRVDAAFVYPNPTHGLINIQGTGSGTFIPCAVYNSAGQLVFRKSMKEGETIDLGAQPKGMYFLYTGEGREAGVTKIIVQ